MLCFNKELSKYNFSSMESMFMPQGEDKIIRNLEVKGKEAKDIYQISSGASNHFSTSQTEIQVGISDIHLGAKLQLEAIARRGWDELENITDRELRTKMSKLRHWRKR
ncbi:hypothetical protein Ssed_0696 [Shewanella sediminis HAW-EB3]|uniref:Uncharacterized protein n=2 Tax=Shewanella sediminis TaxID=271097 RepID=A8FR34_SHESH|nr:hypothetical protein Ssed_0696 [Shewanella sediminis HAW-EB3]